MILALYERPDGIATDARNHVVYDLVRNEAWRGAARVDGPALLWALPSSLDVGRTAETPVLAIEVDFAPESEWLVRCDRVDFAPGGVAYRHEHPGPGIRRLLFGELAIDSAEGTRTYRAGEAWFEGAGEPVLATASATGETAFVRVLLLPREWAGKRTIRYLDPADEEKPKLQRAEVLLEEQLEL